jgi:uncharacterized SAM-binding protein YcdF (DUF218 family)
VKLLIFILGLIIFLWVLIVNVGVRLGFKKAGPNNGQKRDCLILLGYPARKDGTLSPVLRERIRKAAGLYHQGVARFIICSGGAVTNQQVEAEVMAQALVAVGVSKSNIFEETLARGTFENLANSKQIMREKGLLTAVIVSSPWHLRKASSYAFTLEIDHTLEASKCPPEYLGIGIGLIYFYLYSKMFVSLCSFRRQGH